MKIATREDIVASSLQALELDPRAKSYDSVESIAALLRRAAGSLCPCPPRRIQQTVVSVMTPLVPDASHLHDRVGEALDTLVAIGDLLECAQLQLAPDANEQPLLLYAAPPSFVARASGRCLLLGLVPEQPSPLPEPLASRVVHTGHLRTIAPREGEDLAESLRSAGLVQLTLDQWTPYPAARHSVQHVSAYTHMLEQHNTRGDITDLAVIAHDSETTFYPGRWVPPDGRTGIHVGRRPQLYGADLWCCVTLADGRPTQMLDLPTLGCRYRGCDEAWHLQAAIDATNGRPQRFRSRRTREGLQALDFFSPVPCWVTRRLSSLGEPCHSQACLLSYEIKELELPEEADFLEKMLWLQAVS